MHETFGKERVHAILKSDERRFGRAMASALGVGLDEFKKRWDEWLKKKLNCGRRSGGPMATTNKSPLLSLVVRYHVGSEVSEVVQVSLR